jgi:hypothetical protein
LSEQPRLKEPLAQISNAVAGTPTSGSDATILQQRNFDASAAYFDVS